MVSRSLIPRIISSSDMNTKLMAYYFDSTKQLKTPDMKETVLNQGRAKITITIDFGWVTITIKFKLLKDAILEEANPRQTRMISCSWAAA